MKKHQRIIIQLECSIKTLSDVKWKSKDWKKGYAAAAKYAVDLLKINYTRRQPNKVKP